MFVGISGYSEEELLGQPLNLIRHLDMPRAAFQLLWETVEAGQEIFAYVKNMCRSGDHYWVLAHVTPTFGEAGRITGYHSNRRVPERKAVEQCEELYRLLLAEEHRHANSGEGMKASRRLLEAALAEAAKPYEEFVFAL